MQITVTLKGANEFKADLARIHGQLPFALSKALNTTANTVQGMIRVSLPMKGFTLRRAPFIASSIYRRKGTWPLGDNASKDNLTAAVRINPARDVLAKHEEGGAKSARSGRLAIPLVRIGQPNLVIGRGHRYSLKNMPTIPGASATSITRTKRGKATTFYATQTRRGGATIIWESKGPRTPPKAIWVLRPGSVPIPPRLRFHETASLAFGSVWDRVFGDALDQALRTAR